MRYRSKFFSFFLACEYLLFPAPFVEKIVLSYLDCLGLLDQNELRYMRIIFIFQIRAYLWTLSSVPLIYVSTLIPVP